VEKPVAEAVVALEIHVDQPAEDDINMMEISVVA
jgi:hypothetical protein